MDEVERKRRREKAKSGEKIRRLQEREMNKKEKKVENERKKWALSH